MYDTKQQSGNVTFSWVGNEDNEAGLAKFHVGGKVHSIALPSFVIAHCIESLLKDQYKSGVDAGRAWAKNAMLRAVDSL